MKHKQPILYALANCLFFCILAGELLAQAPAAPVKQTAPPADDSGQELLRRAVTNLDAQRSIALKMRHRIEMFGHQLVGTGSYQQLGSGEDRLLRLDMKVQVAGQVTSMQEVCDGRFLWIRRELGGSPSLGRVDLRRVRAAVAADKDRPSPAPPTTHWIALGGLPKLLAGLDANFLLSPPQAAMLGQDEVWLIEGNWRPETLAKLLPAQQEAILGGAAPDFSQFPAHLPTAVRVVLRKSDLFPQRVEYLRGRPSADNPAAPPTMETLVALELYDVLLGAPIDPLHFVYKPGEQEVADHTQLYINALGLGKPATPQAARPVAAPR